MFHIALNFRIELQSVEQWIILQSTQHVTILIAIL